MARDVFNESILSVPPAPVNADVARSLRLQLTEATIKCSERCLYQSAKWAAELLDALPDDEDQDYNDDDSHMLGSDHPTTSFRIFTTSVDDPDEAILEAREGPKYLLAKSFFDTKEFDRCASVFLPPAIPAGGLAIFEQAKGRTPSSSPIKGKAKRGSETISPFPRLSQKSLFLALYARYISGEKRKDEDSEMVLGPADGGQTMNRELPALARGLEAYFMARDAADPQLGRSQGWLEYLYGIVLAKSKQEQLAQNWFLRAIRQNPFHWGAWDELSHLVSSVDDLQKHSSYLPRNIVLLIFNVYAAIDMLSTSNIPETYKNLMELLHIFPTSTFLKTQLALFHYHEQDFEKSAGVFQDLLVTHPYRLDALDNYSNILYVMQDRPKLAFVAHLATSVDKFRPETCCVVGNYYSLCSQHEKAVMYFRRALTLDRSFLSAWTLMGHEYIELKNTHAAIESYRRAVDVNRKDYRAWYGLGQAYEVLDMGFYALFYYQRAAGLRPYDAKMWTAVGSCYAKMDRTDQAIKALKRSLFASMYVEPTESPQASFSTSTSSVTAAANRSKKRTTGRKLFDPDTLFHIASLYERGNDLAEAARYMELCIAQETGQTTNSILKAEKAMRKREQREARARAITEERLRRQNEGNEDEETDLGDGDTEILSSSSPSDTEDSQHRSRGAGSNTAKPDDDNNSADNADGGDATGSGGFGTGTTATTSKARLWLARWCFRNGDLDRSERLAEELCMDGYEVEEAKGLVREVRGQRDGS